MSEIMSDALIATLEPWMSESLEDVCRAVGSMGFNKILELIGEEGYEGETNWVPAWGKLFNVELVPAVDLTYLGQYVGVEVPHGLNEAEARAVVKAENGQHRGTLEAIEAAISRVIGVKVPSYVLERTNAKAEEDAYYFIVIVPPSAKWESGTKAELETAINNVKPGGVLYTIDEVQNAWIEGTKEWGEVSSTVKWSSPPLEGEY